MDAKLFQKEPNCCYYTYDPIFDLQGKQVYSGYEVKDSKGVYLGFYSYPDFSRLAHVWFIDNEFLYIRIIESLCAPIIKTKKAERNKLTYKLRYEVLKRDSFSCTNCGISGKESTLEVDHIIPISKGGKTIKENLTALCLKCNRGKSND